jgi:radical SAM superfamily enzyme YgiQ (UPF0313 family)
MKLFIIQPTHYQGVGSSVLHKTKRRTLVSLTLPYLAALTPGEWDVTLIDEQLTDIEFQASVDLVAITTWTINSFRAYEIADRFRQRGVRVIMGGPHTSFYSDEAAEHCDAVGIGEGDLLWPKMLEDAATGRLQKIYRPESFHPLGHLPFPRYDLLNLRRYGLIKTFSVQSSRGCPFRCEFCSERFYLGHKYRYRPVEDVVEEIKHSKAKNILFADSNFAGKFAHTMELMEALIPLKIRWSTLWSAYLCKNRKFLDLAKRSGLLHVNLGIESIDRSTLAGMNKQVNKVKEYAEIFESLRRRGISYSVNLIFGWDTETRKVFKSTLDFLMEHKVPVAYFNILTPHRGTPLYDTMKAEKRILDDYQMGRWPGLHCYIRPAYCTAEELEEYVRKMYKDFYGYSSMIKRLPLPITKANIASWVVNRSQRKVSRSGDGMENFDDY